MERISMKLTLKIALVISLFCSTALAEGEMGNGGFAGEMGNGGKTCTENCLAGSQTDTTTINDKGDILTFVKDFLTKIFG